MLKGNTFFLATITTALFFFFSVQFSSAHIKEWEHSQGGEHMISNGYVFDFGYSPQLLDTKNISLLDFNVLDENSSVPVEYDLVWVKISSQEQVVYSDGITSNKIFYSGQVKANNGNANFTFFFHKGGDYEISTMFMKDGQFIGEPKFIVRVEEEKTFPIALWFIGSFLLGVVLSYGTSFLRKKAHRVESV